MQEKHRIRERDEQQKELHKRAQSRLLPVKADDTPARSRDECIALLTDIIDTYNSPEFQEKLMELRDAADFEEHRILKRLRNSLLPEFQGPILDRYGFSGDTFQEKKKDMENAVGYWRVRDDSVKVLSKEAMQVIMGDFAEW
eukprot:GHVR01061191.1.p1 GENE.GHVR01061191.1~~GHVR01061191.1.p1  ORF type:complete len:142 (+),score=25.21 GHVR01061191.1:793-1218(+)